MKLNEKSDSPAFLRQGLVAILAAMFLISGLTKFLGSAALLETFANWGYPAWFAYLIGGVELFAGALLLVPHLRVFGAFILFHVVLSALGFNTLILGCKLSKSSK